MSKKMKVLVSVLVAVLLLSVGGVATVMADDGSTATDNETGSKSLLARVAEILDITEEDLVNAFRQARQEMREEAFVNYLDKAVEKGLITPEEADEIKEWWEQRPEDLDNLPPRCFLNKGLLSRHMWGAHRGWSEEAQNSLHLRARIHQAIGNRQMMFTPAGWQRPGPPNLAD